MKDLSAIFVSLLCTLHCLAIPISSVLAASSTFVWFINYQIFHSILLIPIVFLFSVTIPKCYPIHKNKKPLMLGLFGITILILAIFLDKNAELFITVIGALFMIKAHSLNYNLIKPVSG
ncbi:MAG: MerC domain-containing protein [Pseudomonadota bacterium]|nr:MerC domain-containing protein [Pseudomonadota bacterium]